MAKITIQNKTNRWFTVSWDDGQQLSVQTGKKTAGKMAITPAGKLSAGVNIGITFLDQDTGQEIAQPLLVLWDPATGKVVKISGTEWTGAAGTYFHSGLSVQVSIYSKDGILIVGTVDMEVASPAAKPGEKKHPQRRPLRKPAKQAGKKAR